MCLSLIFSSYILSLKDVLSNYFLSLNDLPWLFSLHLNSPKSLTRIALIGLHLVRGVDRTYWINLVFHMIGMLLNLRIAIP